MTTIEQLQAFPDRGSWTDDDDIRQIVIRFGVSGYVVRYAVMPETRDILITRIWHGREAHP
jgi:toxin ParE1/3/4